VEFRLLGPIEVVRDDRSIPLGGAKPRALLALLLLHAGEVVSRDRLIEAVWPGRPSGSAEHSLDVQVSRLRKAFAPDEFLLTRSGGYVLEVEPDAVDATRFERLLDKGRRANAAGDPADGLRSLEPALALWRGQALAEVAYEDFARADAERLEELRLVATEERIDAELALGRHDPLIAELEALTARHPLRERLRGQLMLALYRAGRQAEALRVYSDTRNRLVDELGIEPGQALRELEQAVLRQDPALDLPPRGRTPSRRRGLLVGTGALVLAAAAVALVVGLTQGSTEGAHALAAPDSDVFVDAGSGKLVRTATVRDTVRVAYGDGALWSISSTGELSRVDPATGKEIARLGLGVEPSGLAVGDGSVWVTGRTSPTLLRIDPAVNEVVDRFPLPTEGVVTDQVGEVAAGAGSVWVGHGAFNPGAWVERLDPETGRVQKRFSILAGDVDHVTFAEGALWVASTPSGELRKIDPRTNEVVFRRELQSDLCCVAAGGGYVWAASNPEGVVWKLTTSGRLRRTIELHAPVESLSYGDGALWASLGDRGRAVGIDPTTDAVREYELGHSVTSVAADNGLIAAGVRQSVGDVTAGLSGRVVWIGHKGSKLFDSGAPVEPAFAGPTWDAWQQMFHYATCARLLNYPDQEGGAGRTLVPEVARALPEVSDGGRSYTFAIRKGFRFSPPSNEAVTAESFRDAIERSVKLTRLFGDQLSGALDNVVGAQQFYAGETAHISGVVARDDELVLRFRKPEPDLPWLIAGFSCAVPVDTPVVEGGLEKPVPSAGPYYLATLTDSVAVLKRNPHYGGSRPQRLDAIVVEFAVAPATAATRIESGTLDYFLESQNATLLPSTQAARTAGDRYRLTPYLGVQYFAFGSKRPLFASARMRRAVQYALDRLALVDALGGLPATRLLAAGIRGYQETPLYPPRGDLRIARRLAAGNKGTAVVYTWVDPGYTDAFNRELRRQLAAIGIGTRFVAIDQAKGLEPDKADRADLIWGGLSVTSADPGAYLQQLSLLPRYSDEVRRIATLRSPERERASAALARAIERDSLIVVYMQTAIPELVSRRLGCIVHQPEYAGVDLAALCLKS
jgi:DNA-binding SARP family transcriptional activator/ABC-type transport system substrate-binding protein/streptogramin lyase